MNVLVDFPQGKIMAPIEVKGFLKLVIHLLAIFCLTIVSHPINFTNNFMLVFVVLSKNIYEH